MSCDVSVYSDYIGIDEDRRGVRRPHPPHRSANGASWKRFDLVVLSRRLPGGARRRLRVSQGHNKKLVGDADTDLFLATRFYSLLEPEEVERQSSLKGLTVLPRAMVPEKIFHRTSQQGLAGILQGGMIPGSARTDRSHNYMSEKRLDEASYLSGMRSTQPIEVAINPIQAMESGCESEVTEASLEPRFSKALQAAKLLQEPVPVEEGLNQCRTVEGRGRI